MKFLCLFILGCCLAFAASEKCSGTDTSSCVHTICEGDTKIACVNGLCSCEPVLSLKCRTQQDCFNLGDAWNCPREKRHCVDSMCRCY